VSVTLLHLQWEFTPPLQILTDESTHLITAFVKLVKGKICRLDEYYSDYNDCEDIPDWRKEMKIGKPIGGEDK